MTTTSHGRARRAPSVCRHNPAISEGKYKSGLFLNAFGVKLGRFDFLTVEKYSSIPCQATGNQIFRVIIISKDL